MVSVDFVCFAVCVYAHNDAFNESLFIIRFVRGNHNANVLSSILIKSNICNNGGPSFLCSRLMPTGLHAIEICTFFCRSIIITIHFHFLARLYYVYTLIIVFFCCRFIALCNFCRNKKKWIERAQQ